jgi:hypothetical protein
MSGMMSPAPGADLHPESVHGMIRQVSCSAPRAACVVCNEPPQLIVDEVGNPAREDCYLYRLGIAKVGTDTQEILDFLTASSTQTIPTICPDCGSPLERHTAKFFWAGRAWEVPLINCPTCHPVSTKI